MTEEFFKKMVQEDPQIRFKKGARPKRTEGSQF